MISSLRRCRLTTCSLLVAALCLCGAARAATHTWIGPLFSNWSVPANWSGGVPASGEVGGTIVEFGTTTASVCDIPNLVVDQIHFTGTTNLVGGLNSGSTLGIRGGVLTVNIQDDAGGNSLISTLAIVTSVASIRASVSAGTLTIAGDISGTQGLIKSGTGTLTLTGNNSHAGATDVSDGTLLLNSNGTAIPKPLTIGNGGVVRLLKSDQIADNSNVTVDSGGQLDLNNFSESVGKLLLHSGNVTIGSGTLTTTALLTMVGGTITATNGHLSLGGNISATSSATAGAVIASNVSLNITQVITVIDGAVQPELNIQGIISDGAAASGITKFGTGTLALTSANTFTGTTTVDQGVLLIDTPGGAVIPGPLSIGNSVDAANSASVKELANDCISTASDVTINPSGLLDLNGHSNTIGQLTIDGGNVTLGAGTLTTTLNTVMTGGTITATTGTFSLGENISATSSATAGASIMSKVALNATRTVTVTPGAVQPELTIDGPISDGSAASGISLGSTGTLELAGDNSYSGSTAVNAGTLLLNSSGTAIPGQLQIGGGNGLANSVVVRLLRSGQIGDNSAVIVNSNGLLDLNNFTDVFGALTINAGNITIGTGILFTPTTPTNMAGGTISATTGHLSLGGAIIATSSATAGAVISCGVFLNANQAIFVSPGAVQPELSITGVISDGAASSGFSKIGAGALELTGNNSYTGLSIVVVGTLLLNSSGTAIPGQLQIGAGNGPANSVVVRLLQSGQIVDNSAVFVNPAGLLDLNNFSDSIGGLSVNGNVMIGSGTLATTGSVNMAGGAITATTGTFSLGGNITAASTATAGASITSKVALNATRSIAVSPGTVQPELTITGVISDGAASSGFTKFGGGTLALTSANTFTGTTSVARGVLLIDTPGGATIPGPLSIGNSVDAANSASVKELANDCISTASDVTINPSGLLDLNGHSNTIGQLTIDGGNVTLGAGTLTTTLNTVMTGGTITATTGTFSLGSDIIATSSATAGASITSNVALNATRNIVVNTGAVQPELTIDGPISDGSAASGISLGSTGTLELAGNNSYSGSTAVNAGTLLLNTSVGVAIPAQLFIGNSGGAANSAVVRLLHNDEIADNGLVTVNADGQLDMNGFNDAIGGITGTGNIALGNTAGSALTVGSDSSSSAFNGAISGSRGLTKVGAGTLSLGHDNTYTGQTSVQAGILLVNGSQPASVVSVTNGAILGGTGTVGAATVTGAVLAPGVSGAGQFSTGNLALDSASTLNLDLITPAAGGFDTLNVNGTVALGGSTLNLNVSPDFKSAVGTKLLFIVNGGMADAGAFNNLAEGATLNAGTQSFTISYLEGTGHDVALTTLNTPPVVTSAAMAIQSSAGVGQTVAFNVAAGDANLDPLNFAWTFDDGSSASGASVTHAFTTPGTHNVSVIITDGHGGSVTSATTIVVNAPAVGTGNDSDGDGFSDDFETAAGTDPNSAANTPTGQPATAGAVNPLTISKASIKLNFTAGATLKDSISFSGTLAVPAGFKATGAKAQIDVGGVAKNLTLNAKGNDSVKLALKTKNGAPAKYSASFKKGTFAAFLADEGLTGGANVKPAALRTIVFTLIFNNTILQKSQVLNFTANQGKSGIATAK